MYVCMFESAPVNYISGIKQENKWQKNNIGNIY